MEDILINLNENEKREYRDIVELLYPMETYIQKSNSELNLCHRHIEDIKELDTSIKVIVDEVLSDRFNKKLKGFIFLAKVKGKTLVNRKVIKIINDSLYVEIRNHNMINDITRQIKESLNDPETLVITNNDRGEWRDKPLREYSRSYKFLRNTDSYIIKKSLIGEITNISESNLYLLGNRVRPIKNDNSTSVVDYYLENNQLKSFPTPKSVNVKLKFTDNNIELVYYYDGLEYILFSKECDYNVKGCFNDMMYMILNNNREEFIKRLFSKENIEHVTEHIETKLNQKKATGRLTQEFEKEATNILKSLSSYKLCSILPIMGK